MAKGSKEKKKESVDEGGVSLAQKLKAIKSLSNQMNKKFGNVTGFLSNPDILDKMTIKFWETPSLEFNEATGGGLPKKKISIISGNEDSGKTSFLLQTIALNMKKDPNFIALWLESESSMNAEYCINTFGIDPARFMFIEHNEDTAGETALDLLMAFIKVGKFDIAVVNSLKAIVPTAEFEASIEKQSIGLQARMNSKLMRVITPSLTKNETSLILITHLTTEIGKMYGDPLTVSGGKAIKFHALLSARFNKLSLQDADPITKEEGMKIGFKIDKNHCSPVIYPYVSSSYFVRLGVGIDRVFPLIQIVTDKNIVQKSGAWIRHIDPETNEPIVFEDIELKFCGKKAYLEFIDTHPNYLKLLQDLIKEDNGNNFVKKLTEEEILAIEEENKNLQAEIKELDKDIIDETEAEEALAKALKEG